MNKDTKSSIIKEALADFDAIMNAANTNAKNRLASEFPEKFNSLLNEELNNKKNKAKEPKNNVGDANESEESDNEIKNNSNMGKLNKETTKVENSVIDSKTSNGKTKTSDSKPKNNGDDNVDETVTIQNTIGDSAPFDKKGKTKKANIEEAFDISELDINNVDDNYNENDEIITFDEIEEEISAIENLETELDETNEFPMPNNNYGSPTDQGGDVYMQKLKEMRNQIDEMINGMTNNTNENIESTETEVEPLDFDSIENDDNNQSSEFESNDNEITDAEIESILNDTSDLEFNDEVEEAYGVSHATNKITTAHNPRAEFASSQAAADRRRPSFVNENVKISKLIEENKKLTKKLNEFKKFKESALSLVENYKTTLGKYRNQLKEMAIFNTNLANVNNLLVNESIALTQDDKLNIINEFKKINSITESQNKYKSLLTEMKNGKNTITESIEEKVNTSIQPSSKQKLDEVVEKTAYQNNSHIEKMKKFISYGEKKR